MKHSLTPDAAVIWLEYNKLHRFGTALFLDGKCEHQGYFSPEDIQHFEAEFAWVKQLRKEMGA